MWNLDENTFPNSSCRTVCMETDSDYTFRKELEKTAKENGLMVSEEAKEVLKSKLLLREEIENVVVVEKLIKQIIFERSIENDCKKCVSGQEITNILGKERSTQKNAIGFTADNR